MQIWSRYSLFKNTDCRLPASSSAALSTLCLCHNPWYTCFVPTLSKIIISITLMCQLNTSQYKQAMDNTCTILLATFAKALLCGVIFFLVNFNPISWCKNESPYIHHPPPQFPDTLKYVLLTKHPWCSPHHSCVQYFPLPCAPGYIVVTSCNNTFPGYYP